MSDTHYPPILSGYLVLLMSLIALLPASTVFSSTKLTPDELAGGLQDFYDKVTSLSFSFEQKAQSTPGRERRGSGKGYFYRPEVGKSLMRWDYDAPDRQVIINNGDTVSVYTEKDKQMLVIPTGELQADIMFAFFSGSRKLLDDFSAAPPLDRYQIPADHPDWQVFQLKPIKPNNQLKAVHLWVDSEFFIQRLVIEDHFNSITQLDLTEISLNTLSKKDPKALQAIFSFEPPPGTEIISN